MTKEKAITASAVVLLVISLIGTGIFYNNNKSLTENLDQEKLKTEMMLSEKLALQKEIENFRSDINVLSGKNSELDSILDETRGKLNEKEAEFNKIIRENGNTKTLKKQLAELTQMRKDFEGKVLAMSETINKLNMEKEDLNQRIASLQEENKALATNLEILSSMTADNFLVETTKRKDKLTVIAKRTKKMSVSFKVPENVSEKISFKVTKPDGTVVQGKENGIAFVIVNNEQDLLASLSKDEIKVSKKIEMTYEPKEKLKSGLYKIAMFNGDKYIGTCNVKLR